MTAIDKLKEVSAFLKSKGIEDAAKEAEILITETLRISKSTLYSGSYEIPGHGSRQIDALAARRGRREPLQYIIGHVDFYGLKINVGKGVLIPRPETELIVEEVIKHFQVQGSGIQILDLCTGSGCLALALARHFPGAAVYGTDISASAIKYARENAAINGIVNASLLKGSLYEPLKQLISETPLKFDVIVSNPPYIKSGDIPNLEPEISRWEPRNALDGGEDGLGYYRVILSDARKYIRPDGLICLELGQGQADMAAAIAMQNGFCNISLVMDYAGIERILRISAG